ncbi:hypothetical protein [Halococcus sp. PRR34]|uniref:hypothetical protein n=1 Tax=Halococcus sp. PRR34 TaxID=3020830 RepID=UPI00236158D9|nr:hypothetical protein [Halococcus sp. PRR34]
MADSETEPTTSRPRKSEDTATIEGTDTAISEIALLAEQISGAIGFPFGESESPATSEHLNDDGAWEYHFETDDTWGFVAASPDASTPVETTYPGWNAITVQPGQWAVFCNGTFAGVVSPCGGRIGGYALLEYGDEITDLETAMLDAFRTEHEALTEQSNTPSEHPPHDRS